MNRGFKLLLLLLTVLLFTNATTHNAKIFGVWWAEEHDGKLKFYKATNGKLYAKLVWLDEPLNDKEKPKKDIENPDEAKQKLPLMDMLVVKAMNYDGENKWSGGTIYDSKNGKTYNSIITLQDDNTMELRGYVGFSWIGRSKTLKRTSL